MTGEEFRPRDLPDGWEHSPKEDARQWLTKATETEYYKLRADAAYRRQVFTRQAGWWGADRKSRAYLLGKLLEKNPTFIGESVYQEQLEAMAQRLLKDYALGRLQVAGDVRFLSGDLLQFLVTLLDVERENRLETSRQLHRAGDSEQMEEMLQSYENKTVQESYREAAARGCRQYLERHIQPKLAVQCAAALGKRGFLWDVLLDAVLATARKEERRD